MKINNDTYALIGLIVLGITAIIMGENELAIFCAGAVGGYIGSTRVKEGV